MPMAMSQCNTRETPPQLVSVFRIETSALLPCQDPVRRSGNVFSAPCVVCRSGSITPATRGRSQTRTGLRRVSIGGASRASRAPRT